jgi:hypothetical protein
MLLREYCWTGVEPGRYTTGAVTVEGKPWRLFLWEPPGMYWGVDWSGTDCNIPDADAGRVWRTVTEPD